MATIQQGIYGNFSGMVGNVIGYTWKGKGVMRIRPSSVANPKTALQQQQRGKFSVVLRFVQAHIQQIRTGFKPWADNITAYNAAMSYNLKYATTGEHPNRSIDYKKVLISRGDLPVVDNLMASVAGPGSLLLEWAGSTLLAGAHPRDKLMVSVYNETDNVSLAYDSVAERAACSADLDTPAEWAGKTVQVLVFLIAVAAYGAVESKSQVSNTVWAGTVELI